MRKIIVAIDGYSACGKSTMAKMLANYAHYIYVDTGAMYRAVGYAAYRCLGADFSEDRVVELLPSLHLSFGYDALGVQQMYLNGENIEGAIRTLSAGEQASRVAKIAAVRTFLVEQQRAMGAQKGIVMDGRDIGTVVFPHAELKLFFTATAQVRAQRRWNELKDTGIGYEEVLAGLQARDYEDAHRALSPMLPAHDAIVIDNSEMTLEQEKEKIFQLFDDACRD